MSGKRGQRVLKIDLSKRRFRARAEKYFGEGDYLSALRFAHRAVSDHGADGDLYTLISDIYENMGLFTSAINSWFKYMDECEEEDLPDIYEGLAVNYLNLGNDAQSAFYYDKLIDVDETLTLDNKAEIAEMFAEDERKRFRFVYPPELADYSKELQIGSAALKNGDLKRTVSVLDRVAKDSKEYPAAREMQAIAYLLDGESGQAEKICLELVEADETNVQAAATLSAVYTEQGRTEESRALALKLCSLSSVTAEQRYKIATICCENDLHQEALEHFIKLESEIPYDGNMLYFKGVAAYKSGNLALALGTFERLCVIYPDAAVAKYYLKRLRQYAADPENVEKPELTYFYRVPQEEREIRCRALAGLGKYPREEACLLGLLLEKEGYFEWCFDEMDGMEKDLQYLAVVIAEHANLDSFLRNVLLDCEVKDVLKVEILRLLFLRNEPNEFGVVICNIYRNLKIPKLKLGRKRKKKFLEGYAQIASKFAIVSDDYGEQIRSSAEKLYEKVAQNELWEYADSPADIAAAIYLFCNMGEFGKNVEAIAPVFGANASCVGRLVSAVRSPENLSKLDDHKGEEE